MNWRRLLHYSSCLLLLLAVSINAATQVDIPLATTAAGKSSVLLEKEKIEIPVTDEFWPSFWTAFSMILVSEIGDKTFLIATIMAMRHSRTTIFGATQLALTLMTVISAAFGLVLPKLLPRSVTKWIAAVLFFVFGLKMIWEGWISSPTHVRDEYEEVTHEIEVTERERSVGQSPEQLMRRSLNRLEEGLEVNVSNEEGNSCWAKFNGSTKRCFVSAVKSMLEFSERIRLRLIAPIFTQTFTLIFLAEWGDRSQIATIALAAAQNVWGVVIGASIGHAVCTLMAVVSGKVLSDILSIRTVMMVGGVTFLLFGILHIT